MGQQRHGCYFHSEPCIRGTSISMPNICTVVDSHYLLDADAYDNIRVIQHQHNFDMGIGVLPLPSVARYTDGVAIIDIEDGLQRYHDTSRNRSGIRFPHPQYHNFHHPTLPIQGMRCHSVNFHPPAASYRVPTNPSCGAAIPAENDFEMGARHVGAARTHRGVMHEANVRHQNIPPMGFTQLDDVALLVDHRRDLRLDIEDMSYEELMALGERIGNVSTCLSEEMITTQMKTKTYSIPATAINLEVASEDICIICQDEYKNREKIGILQCGHEYHADCLRKWLLVKNVCPMCKSEALAPGGKGV